MSTFKIEELRNAPGCANPPTFFTAPEYTNWRDEQMSWKTGVSLGNWSFVVKSYLEGPDALDLLKAFSVNSLDKFAINQAKHLINCNKNGKVISQGVVIRLEEEKFFISGLPSFWLGYQVSLGHYKNVSIAIDDREETGFYQIAGPNAIYLMEAVTGQSLRDSKFMRSRNVTIAGHELRAVYGLTMAGETGFELQFDSRFKTDIHSALKAAGERYGLREVGHRTFHINHLEACVPTTSFHYLPAVFEEDMQGFLKYMAGFKVAQNWIKQFKIEGSFEGGDVSEYYRSPVDMGWVNNVRLDHDFLGRAAIEQEIAAPKRQVVTLEFDRADVIEIYSSYFDEGEPFRFLDIPHQSTQNTHTDAVMVDGSIVGVSMGPGYSFYFRKILSLAYVAPEHAEPGTRVQVLWGNPGTRQKIVGATVARAPYKTDTRRIDLSTLSKPAPASVLG